MFHSAFKAGVKRTLSLPEMQQRAGNVIAARDAGLILQAWRARLFEEVAQENVDIITQDKCACWYNHAQTYISSSLHNQTAN